LGNVEKMLKRSKILENSTIVVRIPPAEVLAAEIKSNIECAFCEFTARGFLFNTHTNKTFTAGSSVTGAGRLAKGGIGSDVLQFK
jgi:hypothetical protein